jgi:hypothetical protein
MSRYSIFQATLQESLSGLSIFESQPAEKNSYYALAVTLAHAPTSTLPVIDLAARLHTHIDKKVPVICNIYVTHLVNNHTNFGYAFKFMIKSLDKWPRNNYESQWKNIISK